MTGSPDTSKVKERILEATKDRDRVIDAVKALALTLVIVAHGLAWTTLPDGTVTNTLDQVPQLFWLTWILQILPLFFLLAGTGLVRYASKPSGEQVLRRVDRLAFPMLPLLLVTLLLSSLLGTLAGADLGKYAGLLPIQLIWFVGVYLLVIAVSPLLRKVRTVRGFVLLLGASGLVDVLRVQVNENLGWINLVLVWGLFAALGMHLPALRRLPNWQVALGGVLAAGGAVLAVVVGPYSPALISTEALPGLSNLAPPTIVLALAGGAQVAILLLTWPLLARLLASDRLWLLVAVFSFRAMGLYLYHMLFLGMIIAGVWLAGWAPTALSPRWWALHLAVLAVVALLVWFASPVLVKLGDRIAQLLARLLPRNAEKRVAGLAGSLLVTILTGVCILMMSEAGLSDPSTWRTVLFLPYAPILALAAVLGGAAWARRQTQANPAPSSGAGSQ